MPSAAELLGRYELLERIGQGGMAEVYRARLSGPEGFRRDCVIKRMLPALQQREQLVEMFLNEARITAQLVHPHIVQAFDLGKEAGSYFLALELVDGVHLGQLIDHARAIGEPLPIELGVYIIARAAEGLHFAHDLDDRATGAPLGIVHRDVSPQNILVSQDGDVKVSDFGIAQRVDADGRAAPSLALGKISYMSPEQAMGVALDRRTDIYSLGVVLHELVTRRPLVRRADRQASLTQVIEETAPLPSLLSTDVDPQLDNIIMSCLHKGATERVASAAILSERLDAWLANRGIRFGRSALGRWMKRHAPGLGPDWQSAQLAPSESSAATLPPEDLEAPERTPTPQTPREPTTEPRRSITAPRSTPTIQTPTPAAPSLPTPKTRLIGRRADLERLDAELARGARLVTLLGPGGTGKTRLLLRYGELMHARAELTGGVVFVDLTDVKQLDQFFGAVAAALALPLMSASGEPSDLVANALHARGPTLLLLDNLEQLLTLVRPALTAWLAAVPTLRLLVTSREILAIADEIIHEVLPLRLPPDDQPLDVEGPLPEAIELFVDRARAVRTGYTLSITDAPHVAQIVKLLDGIPLAIELAAARVRLMSPAQIVERLPKRFDLLRTSAGTNSKSTLRGAIDWSWNLLSDAERSVLRQVALFRGGFSLDAALAIVDENEDPLELVESLRQKSLLFARPLPELDDELRFGMYETIRAYALDRLSEAPTPGLSERHQRFFVEEGPRLAAAVDGPDGMRALARLGKELENLLYAYEEALVTSDANAAMELVLACEPIFLRRGPYSTFLRLLDRALDALGTTSPALAARALCARGEARRLGGRLSESRADFEAVLALCRANAASDQRQLEGRALSHFAVLAINQGDLDEAERLFAQAITLHRAVGDRLYLGRSLGQASTVSRLARRLDEAEDRCAQALPILRELGDRRVEGRVLIQLANVYLQRARLDDARREARRAVQLLAEVGDQRSLAYAYGTLGSIEIDARRWVEADAAMRRAVQLARTLGDRRTEGVYTGWLGAVRHGQGRLVEACELYGLASASLIEAGDKSSDGFFLAARGAAHATLGHTHHDAAELDKAEVAFREAERRLVGSTKVTLLLGAELLLAHRVLLDEERHGEGTPLAIAAHRSARALLDSATQPPTTGARSSADESDEVRFALRLLQANLAA